MADISDDKAQQPVADNILDAAIQWQLLLDSGEATVADQQAWQAWLVAHPDHLRVWYQLDALDDELTILPRQAAAPVRQLLGKPRQRPAKKLAGSALGVLGLACCLTLFDRYQPLDGLLADYATGTGEQQQIHLPDNTVLYLNTRTAVDIHFDEQRRAIHLLHGELHIQSGHANPAEQRPLVVVTKEGSIRALGTRFVVHRDKRITRVDVTESAIMARPTGCSSEPTVSCATEQRVEAGYGLQLDNHSEAFIKPSRSGIDAWKDGLLVVENQRLDEVIAELARYRTGFITVSSDVAAMRMTGTLPVADSDFALTALTDALPVRLSRRSSLWIHIEAK